MMSVTSSIAKHGYLLPDIPNLEIESGWLVFAVRDNVGGFEIVGVLKVDKVQNDFLSVLRSG